MQFTKGPSKAQSMVRIANKKTGFGNVSTTYPGIKYSPPMSTPFEPYASASVTAQKNTMCHKIVIATRTKFVAEFTNKIGKMAGSADQDRDQRIKLIEQWQNEWKKDVDQVKSLY